MPNFSFGKMSRENAEYYLSSKVSNFEFFYSNGSAAGFSVNSEVGKIYFDVSSIQTNNFSRDIFGSNFLVNHIASYDAYGEKIFEVDDARLTSAAVRSFYQTGDIQNVINKLSFYSDVVSFKGTENFALGGHGEDILSVSGSRQYYNLEGFGQEYVIVSGNSHKTQVSSIENISFDDGLLIVDGNSASAHIARLYEVLLGRSAKKSEIISHVQGSDQVNIENVAKAVLGSAEFTQKNGVASFDSMINAVYKNIFGAHPDGNDISYWKAQIENGSGSIESIASGWSESVQAKEKFDSHGMKWISDLSSIVTEIENSVLFDKDYYLQHRSDVFDAKMNPVQHYYENGWKELMNPNEIFSTKYYLSQNQDVNAAGVNPLEHFMKYGWKEERNPNEFFNINYYLSHNKDVNAAGVNPLEHFMEYGWKEGRNPSEFFDSKYYIAENRDVSAAGINPLEHFMEYGWKEGRNPSKEFDSSAYLEMNPDVFAAGINPLEHYINYGAAEGRAIYDVQDGIF